MHKLSATVLAVVLVFFGTMAISHVPRSFTVHEDMVLERVTKMTSSESNHGNAVEVDGIRFETLVPEQIVRLSKYGEETPVQFGVRITNQASTPYRFELQRFLPELSDPHGRIMKIEGVNRNTSTEAEESDIPLIMPGESLEFLKVAKISWYSKDCFQLLGDAIYGGIWTFYNLKPGKYQVRLNYENQLPKREILISPGRTEIDGFWIGKITTPFAQLRFR